MSRNTIMKDKLSAVIKKKPDPVADERTQRIRQKFQRRIHIAPNPEINLFPEPVTETVPEPVTTVEIPPAPVKVEQLISAPVSTLPPDLAWLNQPSPFSSPLGAIVNKLRDAKSRIGFTLEQALQREHIKRETLERARTDYESEQNNVSNLRCQLGKIEDNITACAMLAEQSNEIASLLIADTTSRTRMSTRPAPDDVSVCRRVDVIEFFKAHPGRTWVAADVVKSLPPVKQPHAKSSVPMILSTLANEGKIKRVAKGNYQAA
jgi:hypothetical protein